MQAIATERAWHNGRRVWPGQRVDLPDGCDLPAWAQPVELPKPTAPPAKKRRRRKPVKQEDIPAPQETEQDTEQS